MPDIRPNTAKRRYSRRQIAALGAFLALGAGVSVALRSNAKLGVDLGSRQIVARVHNDPWAPRHAPVGSDLSLCVFTDYRCPVCRRSDAAMLRVASRDPGLRIVFKEWPIFGEVSRQAAIVALMANRQGLYEPVHRSLLEAPTLNLRVFKTLVEEADGLWQPIAAELKAPGQKTLRQLQRSNEDAFALGLSGTPGYLIGPILVKGALNERELEEVIAWAREAQQTRSNA